MSGRLFVTGGADTKVNIWEQINGMIFDLKLEVIDMYSDLIGNNKYQY